MDIQLLLEGILPLPPLTVGDLRIDFHAMRVLRGTEEVHLTRMQWMLLCVLARHSGQLLTKAQLVRLVWGDEYVDLDGYNNLEMQIYRLRRKLECNLKRPRLLVNVRGIGYRLQVCDSQ
jgi:DNA-binding response OmpR family regulator